MRIPRPLTSLATAALAASLLVGCGESEGPDDPTAVDNPTVEATTSDSDLAEERAEDASPEPTPSLDEAFGTALTVRVADDRVRPNSAELDIDRGQELTIRVESDRAVELHVHSSPEQYLDFEAGRSQQTVTFERAGVVEIEEHESDQVVAQVTVR